MEYMNVWILLMEYRSVWILLMDYRSVCIKFTNEASKTDTDEEHNNFCIVYTATVKGTPNYTISKTMKTILRLYVIYFLKVLLLNLHLKCRSHNLVKCCIHFFKGSDDKTVVHSLLIVLLEALYCKSVPTGTMGRVP